MNMKLNNYYKDPSLSLANARSLFDGTLEIVPELDSKLGQQAKVIHSPSFESGIIKLLRDQVTELTEPEIKALKCLEEEKVQLILFFYL